MNPIIELQRKCSETTSDIEDILHATSINFKALVSESQQPDINTFHEEFKYLQTILNQIQKLVQERSPLFMSYLIIKQIQDEQTRVRRQRLVQYEEKIYDQKRIIADKQTCFQQLQRPKRKRLAHQTPEQFQQIRAKQRQYQERLKSQKLVKEIIELQTARKTLVEQEKGKKKAELEHTKSSSISQVSLVINEGHQILTDRVTPFDDRKNRPHHFRANSMQHEFGKDHFFAKKEDQSEHIETIKNLIQQISSLQQKNQEFHKIYEQLVTSLKFKKNQSTKAQEIYKQKNIELKSIKQNFLITKKQQQWKFNRVNSPVNLQKRSQSP